MKKANGKWRMCVDYRALNTRTVRDRYLLPSIQAILSTLGGSTVFSNIDLVSGFHEIRIQDEGIEKTAFNTQFGAFEWVVRPFGLCNAPSTFQRVVNDVLRDHLGIFVWVYIDDILVFSKDADEHQRHLDLVHELLSKHQLFPCIDKSTFFQSRVPFCRSSTKMEYTWTPKRSRSFEVGLHQLRSMKFDSSLDCVDFTSSLSKALLWDSRRSVRHPSASEP